MTATQPTVDLTAVTEKFLRQCAVHDAGIPGGCACSDEDYRPTMLALVREVEQARRALSVLRDHPADLDDEGWQRLADRAKAAGYDRRVVTRYRNGKSWATTNIEAAYQQGWRDARAAAKRALAGDA